MAQCTAMSKQSGERCKRHAVPGKKVCCIHGGKSTGPAKGSKNALKHGAYENISRETMFEDEIAFADNVTIDPLETLREQLRVLRVKEQRVLKRMKSAIDAELAAGQPDGNGGRHPKMVVLTGSQTNAEGSDGGISKSASTASETHEMHYLRLEQAHNVVMGQIRRVLEHIAKVEAERGDIGALPEAITVTIVDASKNRES